MESSQAAKAVVTIGDIAVYPTMLRVPAGDYSLGGTTWIVENRTVATRKTPTWAVVCAIALIWLCLFSLLLLLVKEDKLTGYAQVTVTGDQLSHSTQVYVTNVHQFGLVEKNVNFVREMVARMA